MHFSLTHYFEASIDAYERALFDPGLMEFLIPRMPSVREVHVLEFREENGVVHRRRRFFPNPPKTLPAFARVLKPEYMQWEEHSTFDRATKVFHYENFPNIPPAYKHYFVNRGEYRLHPEGPARIRRVIDGELRLKVPLVGGLGEKLIWKEAERTFEQEAKGLQEFLDRGR